MIEALLIGLGAVVGGTLMDKKYAGSFWWGRIIQRLKH